MGNWILVYARKNAAHPYPKKNLTWFFRKFGVEYKDRGFEVIKRRIYTNDISIKEGRTFSPSPQEETDLVSLVNQIREKEFLLGKWN